MEEKSEVGDKDKRNSNLDDKGFDEYSSMNTDIEMTTTQFNESVGMNCEPGCSSTINTTAASTSINDQIINISGDVELDENPHEDNDYSAFDAGFIQDDTSYEDDANIEAVIQKPKIGDEYPSLKVAIAMYRRYALSVGFNIRLGSQSTYDEDNSIRKKHIRCNRYGQPRNKWGKKLIIQGIGRKKRESYYKVCGCMAMVGVHRDFNSNKFVVYTFEENHNHDLDQINANDMDRESRQLSYLDKDFLLKCSRLNIGPTKAHKINSSIKGGYDYYKPTKHEYKNFWRDYRRIVGRNDAQCIVDQLKIRKESYENFSFEIKLDNKVLSGLFWADDISKENYSKFSDVISVDATYSTNRYNMIFVPFTAINHHMKSVTVGAALLANETIDSYKWLLESFIKAHGQSPLLILSDEDPALKQAIESVMPNTHHRLCMWHIMTKMPSKMKKVLMENSDVRSRIHKMVWNSNQSVSDFEEKWNLMLDEFDLREHQWLEKMYRMRDKWIPCYFSHIPMNGLMKTTSRSESSNSFFSVFSSPHNLLVNFLLNFDTALSKQRHEQKKLDVTSNTTTPKMLYENMQMSIEKDASTKYTREVFKTVQKELNKAITRCYQRNVIESGETIICVVVYKNQTSSSRHEFQVTFNEEEKTIECSCNKFAKFGILCCHCFRILLDYEVDEIPETYVVDRWRKNIQFSSYQPKSYTWNGVTDETSTIIRTAVKEFDQCVTKVGNNKELINNLVQHLKNFCITNDKEIDSSVNETGNKEIFERFLGVNIPERIDVEVPNVITNKGGGSKKRIQSSKEKSQIESLKVKRLCHGCDQYVNHDKRNCPINPSKSSKKK